MTTEPGATERLREALLSALDWLDHGDESAARYALRPFLAAPSESSDPGLLAAVEALPGSATFGETWINRRATLDLIRQSRSAPASREADAPDPIAAELARVKAEYDRVVALLNDAEAERDELRAHVRLSRRSAPASREADR